MWKNIFLKDQTSPVGKKLPFFVDIQKVHKNWTTFCFYDKFWIVVVFEIIVYEVGDLKFCVLQRKHVPDSFFGTRNEFHLLFSRNLISVSKNFLLKIVQLLFEISIVPWKNCAKPCHSILIIPAACDIGGLNLQIHDSEFEKI